MFGTRRVIAIRAEGLIRIEEHLNKMMDRGAASILYDEGRSYGSTVVSAYKEMIPEADEKLLIESLKEGSKATCWGAFEFRSSDDGSVHFVLRYPPASSEGWKESRFVYGVFSGILETIADLSSLAPSMTKIGTF